MTVMPRLETEKVVAVIGAGFTGSLFALRLSRARPDWRILLIERRERLGRGLAYGACAPHHILNVPVSRMELGLQPSFVSWLKLRQAQLSEALREAGNELNEAFVPRHLFGDYLEQQLAPALARTADSGIRRIEGEVVEILREPRRLRLSDGRVVSADMVVLATGNEAPALPSETWKTARVIADPWAPEALAGISPDDTVLLVGAGLTMVDMVLSLKAQGHRGAIHAVSRHGLHPHSHQAGGTWPAVIAAGLSPLRTLVSVRQQVRLAQSASVPWQRVFDAIRPVAAAIWHTWTIRQRAQFLRHLRTVWDVHRHRMAPRVARVIETLKNDGTLRIVAGRLAAIADDPDGARVTLKRWHGPEEELRVAAVINCTGPRTADLSESQPLLKSLLKDGLVCPDPLRLGLQSRDCAALDADGAPSDWLYLLGPLTRPAWWEIVAVPEIGVQVSRLVKMTANQDGQTHPHLPALFVDIGAGI